MTNSTDYHKSWQRHEDTKELEPWTWLVQQLWATAGRRPKEMGTVGTQHHALKLLEDGNHLCPKILNYQIEC